MGSGHREKSQQGSRKDRMAGAHRGPAVDEDGVGVHQDARALG